MTRCLCLGFVALLASVVPARADLITYRFEGKLDSGSVSAPSGTLFTFLPDSVEMLLTIDTDATSQGPGWEGGSVHFIRAITAFSFMTNGMNWWKDPFGGAHLFTSSGTGDGYWNVEIENQNGMIHGPSWGAASFDYLYFTIGVPAGLHDELGRLNREITLSLPSPSFTAYLRGYAGPERGHMAGHWTNVQSVPAPSTLAVVLLGIGGWVSAQRFRLAAPGLPSRRRRSAAR